MTRVALLLIGDTGRAEFRQVAPAVEAWAEVTGFRDMPSAARALAGETFLPDVIVLLQSYPNEFSHAEVQDLRRLAPLAPVIGLLGSWCEGEMRSGHPWPAGVRIYWHQWPPRSARELDRMARRECSTWTLPSTATEDERLLADAELLTAVRRGSADPAEMADCQAAVVTCRVGQAERRPTIAVVARHAEMCEWLAAALRSRGCDTVRWDSSGPAGAEVAAAVFDSSDCRGAELDRLRELVARVAPAPVLVLVDFPRIEDHQRITGAGAAAVRSKPLLLEDLFWQLDRASLKH